MTSRVFIAVCGLAVLCAVAFAESEAPYSQAGTRTNVGDDVRQGINVRTGPTVGPGTTPTQVPVSGSVYSTGEPHQTTHAPDESTTGDIDIGGSTTTSTTTRASPTTTSTTSRQTSTSTSTTGTTGTTSSGVPTSGASTRDGNETTPVTGGGTTSVIVPAPPAVPVPSPAPPPSPPPQTTNCGIPANPQNGHVTDDCSPYNMGSCVLACDTGYEVTSGDATIQCINGQWSGRPLVCSKIAVFCTSPPDVLNAAPLAQGACGTKIGDACGPITCAAGYTLMGADTLTCMPTGNYGPTAPRCIAQTCAGQSDLTDCDDGIWCNGKDHCQGGTCSGHYARPCDDQSDNPCRSTCDETQKACVYSRNFTEPCGSSSFECAEYYCIMDRCTPFNAPNGQPCTNPPGQTNAKCYEGTCKGNKEGACAQDADCTSSSPCLIGQCTNTVCQFVPATKGTACNDGIYCNGADTCDGAGSCTVHAGNPCIGTGRSVCNSYCNELPGNCNAPTFTDCSKEYPATAEFFLCNVAWCDGRGTCAGFSSGEGRLCNASDPCRPQQTCHGGKCLGMNTCQCSLDIECGTETDCVSYKCVNQKCQATNTRDGTACNSGNGCDRNPTCQGGKCLAVPACPKFNNRTCNGQGECCGIDCTCDPGFYGLSCEFGPTKLPNPGSLELPERDVWSYPPTTVILPRGVPAFYEVPTVSVPSRQRSARAETRSIFQRAVNYVFEKVGMGGILYAVSGGDKRRVNDFYAAVDYNNLTNAILCASASAPVLPNDAEPGQCSDCSAVTLASVPVDDLVELANAGMRTPTVRAEDAPVLYVTVFPYTNLRGVLNINVSLSDNGTTPDSAVLTGSSAAGVSSNTALVGAVAGGIVIGVLLILGVIVVVVVYKHRKATPAPEVDQDDMAGSGHVPLAPLASTSAQNAV